MYPIILIVVTCLPDGGDDRIVSPSLRQGIQVEVYYFLTVISIIVNFVVRVCEGEISQPITIDVFVLC